MSERMMFGRRGLMLLSLVVVSAVNAAALEISNLYSPRSRERARRKSTEFIILHTTEGPSKGSIEKIKERGEAHYIVDVSGKVYRIIDRSRVAFHAGRSMWNGQTNLDLCSLGIEVVGWHNRDIAPAQYTALRELLDELQRIYRIPDERVLTHCMVAYGAPNRWHKRPHRGRKRCGLLFAKRSTRRRLGLDGEPAFDPDVRAGRLVEADPYLAKVLYGSGQEQETALAHYGGEPVYVIAKGRSAWDIARDRYDDADTVYVFPDGRQRVGSDIEDWTKIPPGTKVIMGSTERGP